MVVVLMLPLFVFVVFGGGSCDVAVVVFVAGDCRWRW